MADRCPSADAAGALERFLSHLEARNASPGTLVEYRRHVTEFLSFLSDRGADWRHPDRATVRAYLASLADRHLAASTVGGRLAAIRSFYRHAARQGWIEADPMAGVRSPRRPGRLPRVLSAGDAARLVEAPARRGPETRRGIGLAVADALVRRDAALLELLYATGMRISEAASLTIDRVDVARRRLRVIGKGAKERELLFGRPAQAAVRAYLAEGRPLLAARASKAGPAALFLNARGGPLDGPWRAPDRRSLGGGDRGGGPHLAAYPAALLRHAPAGGRRRPALRPGVAGSCQPGHHPDLHPPLGRRRAQRLPLGASALGARPCRRRAVREDQPTPLEGISGDPVTEPVPSPGPSTARVLATASLILTVAALASRLLGWIRLLVIGSQFGASRELDAYFAAFRIPDAIFQLVVAGALSAALIPVFASFRARGQEAEAWRLASSIINLVVIALAGLSLLMAIFAPLLVPIVAPGFDAPTTELTIRMTRVMLLSPS